MSQADRVIVEGVGGAASHLNSMPAPRSLASVKIRHLDIDL